MRARTTILAFAVSAFVAGAVAAGTPTDVTVHVIAQGAKFVGTSMGGAEVTIADADTGELLATGRTSGTTGDTEKIMIAEHGRGDALSTPDAAAFTATLVLDRPRRVRITARGPLAQRQALAEASVTRWILPGTPLTGNDGVLLELPGFAVDVLAPPAHVRLGAAPTTVAVSANVVMMCGCPITPGGLWDADRYRVQAMLYDGDELVSTTPLAFAGETSRFAGEVEIGAPGAYEIVVTAFDPHTGATGVDATSVLVSGG